MIKEWPPEGLEHISECPICSSKENKIMYENLYDNIFGCAPGKWCLQECLTCKSAYLNPRPSKETLSLAYQKYYTHTVEEQDEIINKESKLKTIIQAIINGYRRRHFGFNHQNSSILMGYFLELVRPVSHILDTQARSLKIPNGLANKLLDVGCGNGDYLNFAELCGWNAQGLDLDIKAVQKCKERKLNVQLGTIDDLIEKEEIFDRITLAHVIEHVYSPKKELELCYQLLKPGGVLWLETPNIESLGHKRYKNNWRGLEIPRHLMLFNKRSITGLLIEAGFIDIKFKNRVSTPFYTYMESELMLNNERIGIKKMYPNYSIRYFFDVFIQYFSVKRREFLTVTARKI